VDKLFNFEGECSMLAKVYKINVGNSKSVKDTNRFVSMLDSQKFDILLEKVVQSMFSVIVIVGLPYLLYILTKGLF
jgi:hypothetical protein